jgi:act minimal PKS chain-length factor (CLF/KS beta)
VPVTVPKAAVGHTYGAAVATDIAFALLAMRDGVIPPTAGAQADERARFVTVPATALDRAVDAAVVVSRSREGTNVVAVVGGGQGEGWR